MTGGGAARTPGWGLGAHIRSWMLVVGLVPLVVLFLYGFFAARDALVGASDEHLAGVVGGRTAQIEAWLRERVTDLEVIGGSQDCAGLVRDAGARSGHGAVCRYLGSFQTGARDYRLLALFDLDWNWVASHSGGAEPAPADAELRARVERADGPLIGPVRADDAGGAVLAMAAPLREGGGTRLGYVVAVLDLSGTFAPILEDRAGLGKTGRAYLVDRDGRVLVDPRAAGPPGTADAPLLDRARRESAGTIHYETAGGRRVLAGFAAIPERAWILVAEMDEAEALGLLTSLRRGFVLAGVVTLAAVIALSARSSRRISAPLAELAAAARRISRGERFQRVPALAGREAAEVGRAFNEMLGALEDIQRERIRAGTLAAIGELSSGMVHEIRNRLSSVKMNLQALEKRVRDENDYAELARIALEQVRRTEETLTDLLHYARPVDPSPADVDARDLLGGVAAAFRAEAEARGVGLSLEASADTPVLRADRKLLEEAMGNLVRNALEAAPRGGRVILRAAAGGGSRVVLEVEDDGPGLGDIPPEDLFRPFFSTKERGAGLGLASVRKIAELHGGRAEAEGVPGRTVFRMELPGKERR